MGEDEVRVVVEDLVEDGGDLVVAELDAGVDNGDQRRPLLPVQVVIVVIVEPLEYA